MSAFPRAIGVALLVALLVPLAAAHEERIIELPRAGLSLDVPRTWTVEQYGDALLELRMGDAVVWVRGYEAAASRKPGRVWTDDAEGGARCQALIERGDRVVFEVEAIAPDDEQRTLVDEMLDSVDTTPYLHATRHVDWRDEWTLTLPEAWARIPAAGGVAAFAAEDGSCRLWVEKLGRLWKAADGGDVPDDLDGWAEFAWKEGLHRLQESEGVASEDAPTVETVKTATGEGRRMHLGLDPDEDGKPRAWMHVLVREGHRVLVYCKSENQAAGEAMNSFHAGTEGGPRVSTGLPEDRFPGDKGPPVVFTLPEGWTLTEGTNQMRVAQFSLPGIAGTEGVVFFFGAGRGGGIEANLERWRGQMKGDDEGTVETFEPAADVKITVLDVTGAYTTSQTNPHGADPHGGDDAGHGGFRMIGAVIEIPQGPLFVKFIGPDGPVAEHANVVKTWLLSFRPAK